MDYANGIIYKIVNNENDKIYIGSTCRYIRKRLWDHRKKYNQWIKNKSPYITSFEILKYENVDIVLLEKYPCKSKLELHTRERYHIENNNCVNKIIPTQTDKEYRKKNKDKLNDYNKQYRLNNKNKCHEHKNEKFKCDICDGSYSRSNKSAHLKTKKHLNFVK